MGLVQILDGTVLGMVSVTDGDDHGNDENECREKKWGPERVGS